MSVTVEEPQRAPEGDIPIAKETSEKEPDTVDNNADAKKAAKPTQYGDNDKSDRGAPRIIMAYIPASAPASPSPSYSTPAPGRNTPEASNGRGRPVTPNLTAKLNQAIHEYRAREERVGDLGQPDDEGYEGDTYFPDEHQGCCDHDHYENQHAAHDEQRSPLHLQQGCGGPSPSVNVPECWTPYHPASSAPLYMQPPFGLPFQQQQQQQYAVPCYPPVSQPCGFPFPFPPHYFPNPHQFSHHHQHFSTPLAPSTHPFAPPARPPHFHPIPPQPQPQPRPFPPHHFQHPQFQDPTVIELTQRLQNVQAQLNGLDAAHEVEIWRHGKYNFHRRRAKQLRKIKRERVEEMVTVVRELRALGVSGGHGRHRPPHVQPQGQQEMQGMWSTAPGWGYGTGFEQGWGYGQAAGYWPGLYGHQQGQWLGGGYGHGHGQAGSWSEVEVEYDGGHGECGCGEDGAHVDSPRDSAFESMTCECGCTTIDGEADPNGELSDVVTPEGTRARALSLDGMREQVDVVEAHEQQNGDASGNEQGESAEKNSSCARAGSWSGAQAVISEELRGNWRKKMSE